MAVKKEKSLVCTKEGQWFVKTPKPGRKEALRAQLTEQGYSIRKEVSIPTLATLEKWSNDGVAKTLMGEKIEPDGYTADGCPSWLIHLGVI